MKKCKYCLVEKELKDFPKSGRKCKLCISIYRKLYKENNKEKIKEASKKYYKENKERILEYSKKFYENNKDHYKKYRKDNKDSIKKNHEKYVKLNKDKIKEYNKNYREKNKEKITENKKKYYEDNKDRILKQSKKYYKENKKEIRDRRKEYDINYRKNNKEKIKKSNKKWRENNKKYYRDYIKNRSKNDELFKLKISIRNLIRSSFYNEGVNKNSKTTEILGCSFEEFKSYLESKFEPWMKWENYGLYNGELNYGWDIDHIIPLSSSNIESEIINLNHYSNLQPLCSKINRDIKRNN